MTGGRNSPGGKRATRPKRLTTEAAKDRLVELVSEGQTLVAGLDNIGYARKTYEYWRRQDDSFKARIDQARQLRGKRNEPERGERLDFEAWRLKYLGVRTPWHQLQWVDLLEGREPRDLHPSQQFEPGKRNRILINCPPFHGKALALDTTIPTPHGWKTMGSLREGDQVFGPDGKPTTVVGKSQVHHKPCFEVTISDGEKFTACEDHLWEVRVETSYRNFAWETFTTRELFERGEKQYFLPKHEALHMEPLVDLPLDPYLLGAWLGDGSTLSGSVTSADAEVIDAFVRAGFAIGAVNSKLGSRARTYNLLGLYPILSELGIRGGKFVPEGYLFGSYDQRLALLQGLMDTDGTISSAGQASFTNKNKDLAEGVLYLASSLGLRATIAEGRATLNGKDCGPKWIVSFTPADVPVFRLERKLCRQTTQSVPGRGVRLRRITSIRPVEMVPTQCIQVDNDSHLYLIGKGLVPTHNTVAITIDYVTYRLCMDPAFRVLLISAGSELAKDFLFGVKQRLTSPEFLDLQKAYAPDGGWEATAESWTESKIVFGTDVRAQSAKDFAEKDANALALGMRSKVYGRRADLVIVDDGVDSTNVSEHAKQMKWLRGMVESRIEAGGKLLVIGTRVASVDLYSELLNPANYASQRVPWTYLASPAILEEGAQPSEHKTLWPYAEVPWVQPEDATMDECLCEDTIRCSQGLEVDGRKVYARWDGLHLENGPRASNNNTEWALIFQQKSVAEDATFPEHAVSRCTNGKRPIGLLKQNTVGHPHKGMHGMYVIAGLDPSIKGFAGIIVYAVDRETKMRYVLQAVNMKAPTKKQLEDKMKDITVEYGVHEWRVEKTGLLQFFTQDAALRQWFSSRGVRFTEHTTGSNKWDAGFGVSSLASLFGEYDKAWDDPNGAWREITPPLIELPRPNLDGMKALIHQLITWTPDLDPNKVPCDMVMALWFAEVGAREHLGVGRGSGTVSLLGRTNRYTSPRAVKNRTTVSLADFRSGS